MKKAIMTVFVLLMAVLLTGCASHASEDDPVFIRIDRDDPEAWKGELGNVRFLAEERMSGSAQFSADQFLTLAAQLRERSEDVWIVDCRLETHSFINGIAVSWCSEDNAANRGKSAEQVNAEEEALSDLVGTTVTAYTTEDDRPVDGIPLSVENWETERALAESEGFHYLRLACPDHCWPPADVIDAFIDFAESLDGGAWLHFHCQAGSGRTGGFMTIYEMMQRPGVPVEEILRHQADTGSGNLADRAKPEKSHAQKERCVLARAMYLYIQENRASGYGVRWSEWLGDHSRTVVLKVGDGIEGEGFSSDTLVVSDSGQALASGQATVLTGDTVYFITVEP